MAGQYRKLVRQTGLITPLKFPAGHKPLIGVTGPDGRFVPAWWFTRFAVWLAGGKALRMTPNHPQDSRNLDGLIIGGGDDIDPGLYMDLVADEDEEGQAPMNPERDAFEQAMIAQALNKNLPLLGICRGAQLINVVQGGTLYPDIRDMRIKTSNKRTPFPTKDVLLAKNSQTAKILEREKTRINSLHHQAVDQLGHQLRIAGKDADGIIQAIEGSGEHFILGVQWHPEYLPQYPTQRRIFRSLVTAAGQGSQWPC